MQVCQSGAGQQENSKHDLGDDDDFDGGKSGGSIVIQPGWCDVLVADWLIFALVWNQYD